MTLNLPAAPLGKQELSVNYGGTTLRTFTYRPEGEIKGILLNFHGAGRNAEGARDTAIKVANERGLYVVAPMFEEDDFSSSDYNRGGMLSSDGKLLPKEDWTVSLVDDIAEWAHAKVGNLPGIETIAFGHSAGGQFMSRVAAFGPDIFDKMIIANPSTHVRASLTEDMPYGFDGSLTATEQEAYLRDYLADPITIYAGSADNDPNAPELSGGSAAMRQGDDRLERAHFVYNEAKELAEEKGWEFNWELVVAKGVGHSERGMLHAPEFQQAFDGRTDTAPAAILAPANKVFGFETSSDWHGSVIKNYVDGDVFDFRDIDANVRQSGDQAFDFLGVAGTKAFTTDGAQIRLRYHDGDTYIYLNTDGDAYYEAKGRIEGLHQLSEDDFLL
ncbi:hypothetical protein RAH32_14355 [Paracoccus sp. WLY502]|uniref:alpha/beta hydrolase n=1 Tax=Paracoccus yibinensis TaxID=3068891 RepID=UPI00279674D1|nr:hypothetical protein [Paracoccus sp. WLY502]MDQ1901623.1 hypothetical protein [Paracoccus sp. WLY502]